MRRFKMWSAGACAGLMFIGACTHAPQATSRPITNGPATLPATQPTSRPALSRVRVVSPEVLADGRVTFRVRAPKASLVELSGDWPGKNFGPLTVDADGIWSGTFGPIDPGLWGYSFKIDGRDVIDPVNPAYKPARTVVTSVLSISGAGPLPWERRAGVPRGVVHLHDYDSKAIGKTRRLRVYTPPDYATRPAETFPVLYLLHGSGDNEMTWTEFGRANVILDNLIADGKARPMVVVMTDGHAIGSGEPDGRRANLEAFSKDLIGDVMPLVESTYRVRTDRDGRAIAGLSMGGNQALVIGLGDTTRFGWIAGMSSAVREPEKELAGFLAAPASAGPAPRLLWMQIGRDDFLLKENRRFDALLTERNVVHTYVETAGTHAWRVWRQYLIDLAPLLFVESPATGAP